MSCMWRKNGCGGSEKKPPADVPRGHLAVTVGEAKRRFVIRADYLNHPLLQQLLEQASYEGYGFNKSGPLAIPCDEFLFENIIQSLQRQPHARRSSSTHVPLKNLHHSFSKDSLPLLHHGFDSKSRSSN
ncbi:auxin-responsive protein SAUR50-like [Abrus precatorius]|uniref:Auxin-responsive protein SAUR50-like n=1 Tax=Abrus precatorius TaxID=3816 RepID=A0A8B8M5E4_ABRPR|nr:auxin-responsive protein SAUR50-like [Abrus precatorius]